MLNVDFEICREKHRKMHTKRKWQQRPLLYIQQQHVMYLHDREGERERDVDTVRYIGMYRRNEHTKANKKSFNSSSSPTKFTIKSIECEAFINLYVPKTHNCFFTSRLVSAFFFLFSSTTLHFLQFKIQFG